MNKPKVKKPAGLRLTEVICGPRSRCYALQHVLDLKGLESPILFDPKTGKSRTGIGVRVQIKAKGEKKPKPLMLFFTFCPFCGGPV